MRSFSPLLKFVPFLLLVADFAWTPAHAENLDDLRKLLTTGNCVECDLRRADLVLANLEDADLTGANLAGANLSQSNLTGANLAGANLSGATLVGSNFMGANLATANLSAADLRNAYLFAAILDETNLEYANLQGAVGIPTNAGRFEDFHNWGVASAKAGRHEQAVDYYNQALARNPEFALTYLSRAISRQNINDTKGAIVDSQTAAQLFETQGNTQGKEVADNLTLALEESLQPQRQQGGFFNSLRNTVQSVTPLLLRFIF
ncbi:MAG: pentapeptide repeat-containing protein [Prochlorotrichaceae cyanobacterium]